MRDEEKVDGEEEEVEEGLSSFLSAHSIERESVSIFDTRVLYPVTLLFASLSSPREAETFSKCLPSTKAAPAARGRAPMPLPPLPLQTRRMPHPLLPRRPAACASSRPRGPHHPPRQEQRVPWTPTRRGSKVTEAREGRGKGRGKRGNRHLAVDFFFPCSSHCFF